jgi:hypothetical protein
MIAALSFFSFSAAAKSFCAFFKTCFLLFGSGAWLEADFLDGLGDLFRPMDLGCQIVLGSTYLQRGKRP